MERENTLETKLVPWSDVVRAVHEGVMKELVAPEKSKPAPRDRSKLNAERRTGVPRDFRTSLANNKIDAALRSTLPAAPCFRCNARGWCDHRSAEG
jgi:hypothetical protein